MITDAELVDQTLAGNHDAFTQLRERHHVYLRNVIFSRQREMDEDLEQEAWMSIWVGLKGWKRQSSFRTWAARAAINRYNNKWRTLLSRKRNVHCEAFSLDHIPEAAFEGDFTVPPHLICRDRHLETVVERLTARRTLDALISRLTPKEQTSIGLFMVDAPGEICAKVLGTSQPLARIRRLRALEKIKMLAGVRG